MPFWNRDEWGDPHDFLRSFARVWFTEDDPIGELPALIEAGVPTFKAFMVYDFALPEERLEQVLRTAARHGGMLQLHCEDPGIIEPLIADALARGEVDCRHHALTRPP